MSIQEEFFDVVDRHDRVLWQAPRSVVHARRWLHRAVHIFVRNSRGELLVHLRSAEKDDYPLCYTSSASGHLHAGEDYRTAAARELEEELGLRSPIRYLGKFDAGPDTAFEHSELYDTVTDETPIFDPREIASGDYYPLPELMAWVAREPSRFTPCFLTLLEWYVAALDQLNVTPAKT